MEEYTHTLHVSRLLQIKQVQFSAFKCESEAEKENTTR